MGVAALDFPKGLEFSNSHQFFYIPSRNISCTQTFVRNLFADASYYSLTIVGLPAEIVGLPDGKSVEKV